MAGVEKSGLDFRRRDCTANEWQEANRIELTGREGTRMEWQEQI